MMESANSEYSRADDAAAEWLMAHDRGLSEAEQADFASWRDGSPANAEAWENAQRIWQSFDAEPDALLASIRDAALSARAPSATAARLRQAPLWGAIAAAVVVTAGIAIWSGLGTRPGTTTTIAQVYSTVDHRSTIVLADGSRVVLDARSRIAVNETDNRRDVALQEGRAFFKVAHDTARPFVVAADGRTVTATGTAFSVATEASGLAVVLEEGHVRIDAQKGANAPINLSPGQRFFASSQDATTVQNVDVEDALSWREGYLSLHNATVREALSKMDHAKPPHVVLGDVAVGDLRVSGRFRADDPDTFVQTLAAIYPVRVIRLPSGQKRLVSTRSAQRARAGTR